MYWDHSAVVSMMGLAALASLGLVAFALVRREAPAAREFAAAMALLAWWACAAAAEAAATDTQAKLRWSQACYVGGLGVPTCWLWFVATYTRRRERLGRRGPALLAAVALLALALVVTNGSHHLVWPRVTWVQGDRGLWMRYDHGPVVWFVAAYDYVLLLVSAVWLVGLGWDTSELYRRQVFGLLAAAVAPWVANIVYLLGGSPVPGIDLTPVGFAVSGLVLWWTLWRFQMLDLVPVARHQVVESLADAVLVVDARGRLADCNPAARALLGASRAVIGWELARVLEPWPRLLAALAEGAASTELSVEVDGTLRWWFLQRLTLGRDGQLLVLRDTTARRQAEEARLQLERGLHEARRMEGLGVLAAGVAHDFNNLLTSILGYTELSRDELPAGSPAHPLLGRVTHAAEEAARLTGELLAYSGQRMFRPDRLDLARLVAGAAELLAGVVTPPARLVLDCPRGLPWVEADAAQLRHALGHLVSNAREALGDSAGTVTVGLRLRPLDAAQLAAVELHGAELVPGDYLELAVSDDGCGLSEQVRDRMFEPFFTTKFLGRGLGLAAVLGVTRGHGGAVLVESEVGRGTRVALLLPAVSPTSV